MPQVMVIGQIKFEPPPDLKIYRLRRAKADHDSIRRIGSRFGLRAEIEFGSLTEDAASIAYSERQWTLRLFRRSGGWHYRDASRWQADDGRANMRVEDAEAF